MSKKDPTGDRLTLQEIEVIQLLSEDKDRNQIAEKMCLSIHSVRTYTTNIHHKLGVNTAAGCVGWAHRNGLLP